MVGLCRCCVLEAQGNINGTGTMTTPRARLMLTLFFVNQRTRRRVPQVVSQHANRSF